MTMPRRRIVPQENDCTLHLISRCVRRAFLCGEDADLGRLDHRKVWIENRLAQLTQWFGVEVLTYAFMSNHFHLVVTLKRSVTDLWSDEQVVRRWVEVFPSKKFLGPNGPMVKDNHIKALLENREKVAQLRLRLGDCGWLMKALKEPISRQANREDDARGAFWEGRYKSVWLQDETAILACMAYVDLNPLRAGLAKTVEAQADVGIAERIAEKQRRFEAFRAERENQRLAGAEEGGKDLFRPVAIMREKSWLKPMDGPFLHQDHELTLEAYISILEFTAQGHREGKAKMDAKHTGALTRLGLPTKAESWERMWRKLKPAGRCLRLSAA